jgi:hypothetical protein
MAGDTVHEAATLFFKVMALAVPVKNAAFIK